ncbi:MAG: AMP-binding protein [Acidobacteriales bacterium]|nr:AMP-binding protein [Terriglobales bacterium]
MVQSPEPGFLQDVFAQIEAAGKAVLLREIRDGQIISATGFELLEMVGRARVFLRENEIPKTSRCALLAHNSIRWVAMDLAAMAEGLIVVPLYARQAASELVTMMKDCTPALICCGDALLSDDVVRHWPAAPPQYLFDDIFSSPLNSAEMPITVAPPDAVTIIYTSGTSGEAKGVVLNSANITHMLRCTSARLDVLMNHSRTDGDRVFHYLPFCFAGSWIMLLTCLRRRSVLTVNTDLSRLAHEMRESAPDYFLNVPALLERMRKAVDEQLSKTGGIALAIYQRAKTSYGRQRDRGMRLSDRLCLACAKLLVFPTIRKKMIGANLKALICGSAPLNIETQSFFMMLGIPVLQVYGLTETTAICTMDDPRRVEPGRVGPAIPGVEMKLGENDEIIVRGANIFPGYWDRPQETARVVTDGWFHTGDQGEVNEEGNWRVTGRIKNLIVLGSGHNIAPEPIEEKCLHLLSGAQQVVLVGNGRGYLSAIVTGKVTRPEAQVALDTVNAQLPHYKQIRQFYIQQDPFSIENGLLTANGKLKRDLIAARLGPEIEAMYAVKQAS